MGEQTYLSDSPYKQCKHKNTHKISNIYKLNCNSAIDNTKIILKYFYIYYKKYFNPGPLSSCKLSENNVRHI